MLNSRILLALLAVLGIAAGPSARASEGGSSRVAARSAPKNDAVQVVQLSVTSEGFVPSQVAVKAGKLVRLVVTRKTDRTCATEIVMKDFGVKQALPLDKPVTVEVTPKKAGDYRYACGMDMIAGVLKVE
jgi:plastocyanin domain-containing protein